MGNNQLGYRIMDLDSGDRPRERLAALGPGALSNAELLAIILRTGIKGMNAVQLAQTLLVEIGGLAGLHRLSLPELQKKRGIGIAKAAQIQAAIELGRRFAIVNHEEKPRIQSPQDAANLVLYEMGALEQEHLRVLLLDTRNQVIQVVEVYRGSLNSSVIRVGEIFREAVRRNAAAIIVAHNHPSGDPTPSPEDVAVTRAIVEAGKLLDIEVLDHLVIGKNRYISLKSKGMGFNK
ncbi:MAG: DNA repair protein RadC [Anaerolineales bacterium]|nr:DNA repair protein RadC [Anaerolineales bacterium]